MEHRNCRSGSTAVINQDLIQSCEMPRLINLCQHFPFHQRLLSLPASPLPLTLLRSHAGQAGRLHVGRLATQGCSQALLAALPGWSRSPWDLTTPDLMSLAEALRPRIR